MDCPCLTSCFVPGVVGIIFGAKKKKKTRQTEYIYSYEYQEIFTHTARLPQLCVGLPFVLPKMESKHTKEEKGRKQNGMRLPDRLFCSCWCSVCVSPCVCVSLQKGSCCGTLPRVPTGWDLGRSQVPARRARARAAERTKKVNI